MSLYLMIFYTASEGENAFGFFFYYVSIGQFLKELPINVIT